MARKPLSVEAIDEPAEALFGDIAQRLDEEEGIYRRGSPPWIITFADMITLLLAFFVLLLSFSDLNITRFRDVSGSLQQSLGKEESLPLIVAPPAQTQLAGGPAVAAGSLPEQLAKDLGTLQKVMSADLIGQKIEVRAEDGHLVLDLPKRAASGVISQEMLDLYAKIADAQSELETLIEVREGREAPDKLAEMTKRMQQLRTELAQEIGEGKAQVERDGERIVVRMLIEGSFYSGSADLSPDFYPLLNKIGRSISSGPGRITIEGHTDNIPVAGNSRYRSNWDLSGARAAAVADYLIEHGGVARERVIVRGLADVRPLSPNSSREGRAKNRRIELLVDTL